LAAIKRSQRWENYAGKMKLLPRRERQGQQWRHFGISSLTFPFTEPGRKETERKLRQGQASSRLYPTPLPSRFHLDIVVARRQSKINGAEVNTFGVKSCGKRGNRESGVARESQEKSRAAVETSETMVALTLKESPLEEETREAKICNVFQNC